MLFYSLLLITAGLLILKNHRRYHLFTPDYWSFIFTPLKVAIYLLYRDGYYMPDWLFNIPVGIVCYITAGLVWNIEWNNGHRRYAFTKEP